MSLLRFRTKVNSIHNFVRKLEREDTPISTQKILIKVYATHLRMHLTDKIIEELLSDQYFERNMESNESMVSARKM